MKNKKFRISILILITIVAIWGINKIFVKKENFPLFTVTKGQFLIDINADGQVEARNSVTVSPPRIRGNLTITEMVDEGTYVKKGDFLLQFDTSDFLERVETFENELENAKAAYESQEANIKQTMADLESSLKIEEYSLEQAEINYANSKYEAENTQKGAELSLKKEKISYNQLVDKIEKTKEINKASLRQAELQVKQAEISLRKVKDDLESMTIKSPVEGLVVYKKIWSGDGREKIKIGSSLWWGTPLMEIPSGGNMNVKMDVNEVDISSIKKGQKVNVKIDALPEDHFTGEITSIASLAHVDEETKKSVFEIEVLINELDERIKPGMSCDCQIIIAQMDDVISVPIDAVAKENGQTGVYNPSGKFISVETGMVGSDLIVIKSGLKSGDKIRLSKAENSGIQQEEDMEAPKQMGAPGGPGGGRPPHGGGPRR